MKPCRKLRPPIGPISPAQNMPAQRPPVISGDQLGVVVRPAEQVRAAAVAREHERAVGLAGRAEHRPQVLVGGVRVADVELDGRADLDVLDRSAIAPFDRSAPSTARTRKSPRSKLSFASSTTTPRWSPAWSSARSSGAAARRQVDHPLEGGLAGELVDDVALRPGDDHRLAERTAALRHERLDDVPGRQQHADRAVVVEAAVEHEAVAARAAGRRREPADRRSRPARASSSSSASAGNENGSASSTSVEPGVGVVRQAAERPGPRRPSTRLEPHRRHGSGRPGPERRARSCSSTSWPPRQQRHRGGADQGARPQHRVHGADHVLERAGHRGGGEQHGEVGLGRHRLEDLAEHLAGGLGGDRVLGEGGGEGHVSRPAGAG